MLFTQKYDFFTKNCDFGQFTGNRMATISRVFDVLFGKISCAVFTFSVFCDNLYKGSFATHRELPKRKNIQAERKAREYL